MMSTLLSLVLNTVIAVSPIARTISTQQWFEQTADQLRETLVAFPQSEPGSDHG